MNSIRLAAILLVLAAAPGVGWAQAAARIALLGPDEQPRFSDIAAGLAQGLREQGHSASSIQIIELRAPRGDASRARAAVEALTGQQVRVAFVIGSNLAKLARDGAPALPIVFITPGDPVEAGLLASLARPGRNMTALTFEYPELSAKRLELLHDLAPGIRRILVLYDPRDPSPRQGVAAARAAASSLGMTLVEVPAQNAQEIAAGLQKLDEVDALLGIPGGFTSAHYEAIVKAANTKRRPTVLFANSPATREALLSYGSSDIDVARQAARAVVKILNGANAGELAVERPATLTLVINLRTAKALGVHVPQSLMLRANRVIE